MMPCPFAKASRSIHFVTFFLFCQARHVSVYLPIVNVHQRFMTRLPFNLFSCNILYSIPILCRTFSFPALDTYALT